MHALISYIRKLYYQCVVKESQQDFLRSLWHKDNDFRQPIVKNTMTCLSFGLFPAQSAALYCLEQAIFDNVTQTSIVTIMTAIKKFYIDDGLFSFPSKAEHISFFKQIVPLLASHTFPLTKLFTTCEGLKKIIPNDDLLPVKTVKFKDEACLQNTLGMTWCSQDDYFKFDCLFSDEIPEKLTRRVILSMYSRIFYPLGCIQPFVLHPN